MIRRRDQSNKEYSLVKWKVIVYANVTVSLTLVSNKLDSRHFLHISPYSGSRNSQDSHKNQYPYSVLMFGFMEPQYSDKCWSYLTLNWLSLPLVQHTEDQHNYPIHALVNLFGTSYLASVYHTCVNDTITSPANFLFTVNCDCDTYESYNYVLLIINKRLHVFRS